MPEGNVCNQGIKKPPHIPILGITMGDPAGVGPEVILKALTRPEIRRICFPVIIGDGTILKQVQQDLDMDIELISMGSHALDIEHRPGDRVFDAELSALESTGDPGAIYYLDLKLIGPGELRMGEIQPGAGRAAVRYIKAATDLALSKEIAGIVTAPINKAAMNQAGFSYAGHTELLQSLTGAQEVAMLLYVGGLGISHVTTHVALSDACRLISKERVLQVLRLTHVVRVQLGQISKPIAVAGLNPHSGEGGLFGQEELTEIAPAIEKAQAEGIDAVGPLAPDTVFLKAHRGMYDFVVAMYHDQGHIPAKLLGFETGVNVTLGLPIVRTSVDHGTAFDIAGKGVADCQSMVEAIKLAARLAKT